MQCCNGRTASDFISAGAEHTHKLVSGMLPSYNFPSYIFLLYSIPLIRYKGFRIERKNSDVVTLGASTAKSK